jgi:hypothetical protein
MYNLIGTVSFPTTTTNTSATAIDNIFVDKGRNYTIKPQINGLSDHDAQLLVLNNIVKIRNNNKSFSVRNINKKTIAEFQLLLSMELWEDVFNVTDVNSMFNNFLKTYIRCYNTTCEKINISTSNLINNGWITKGIKVSCKRKKELFVLCKIINTDNLKQYYKKYCRILRKIIRSAKKLYYNNIIFRSKNGIKSTWKIINNECGRPRQNTAILQIKLEDILIENQHQIANAFNKCFLTVADHINEIKKKDANLKRDKTISHLSEYYKEPFEKIKWQYVSTQEIRNIIKSLKTKNTYGYDEISNRIIKLSAPHITSTLTYICNAVLYSGVFPDRLKYAIVRPIYKKGGKQEISNYRPISLLTSISKVFKKIIYDRLYAHLERNNILVQEQFGFRRHHST